MAAAPYLLHVPAEIRLAIYKLLLSNHDDKTLSIRTEDPTLYEQRKHQLRLRTKYHHISDRFRGRSIRSSYHLRENPGIYPSILGVNRQTHAEAGHVLYSQHIFDFGMDIESAVPFLQDLTPSSRESVKRIGIVKRAIPYSKSFDNCEWQTTCTYISENLQLAQLDLGVLGGVPGSIWGSPPGQQEPKEFSMSDFHVITMFENMEWARQLAAIKGLQMLNVKAIMEHCPPPQSSTMTFFVNFSASIEKGFREYMSSVMVT
jgi:hypothetical protein